MLRYNSLSLTIAAAILAAVIVSTLTVDLGPLVRERVEQAGSSWLKRAVRIGSLHLQVFTGRLLLDDLSIDGRRPEDRPFFTAKRLSVSLDWSTALRRRPEFTVTSVELTDWQMLVEEWPDGHNFPKFTSDDTSSNSNGPRRFTTTLRYLRAWRGQFTYQNHEGRWGVVAPNIDLHITRVRGYEGEAAFSGGTITIQDNLPMWANMKASFAIDGSTLHMNHIDIDSDGARSVAVGDVDLTRWPEMMYDVRSRVNFPRMREIFFRDEPWELAGDGDFTGRFHLFKGGHDLAGAFTSDALGVYAYRFRSLFGSLHWTRKLFEVTSAGSDLYGGASRFAFSIKPVRLSKRMNMPEISKRREPDLCEAALSQRQTEVLRLLGDGKTTPEIAAKFKISLRTVQQHCTQLKQKLDEAKFSGLVQIAILWHAGGAEIVVKELKRGRVAAAGTL